MLEVITCIVCVIAINLNLITFEFILNIRIKTLENCEIFMIFKNMNFIDKNAVASLNLHLFMLLTFLINI